MPMTALQKPVRASNWAGAGMSDRSEVAREIGRIIRALDLLLTACERHRNTPIKIMTATELVSMSPVEGLLDDPIGRSLRLGIRRLGERLDQLGGFTLMQAVAERVAGSSGRRLCIIDHAFDGVGTWVA